MMSPDGAAVVKRASRVRPISSSLCLTGGHSKGHGVRRGKYRRQTPGRVRPPGQRAIMTADPRSALHTSFLALLASFTATTRPLEQTHSLLLEDLARGSAHAP